MSVCVYVIVTASTAPSASGNRPPSARTTHGLRVAAMRNWSLDRSTPSTV
jgi:hypothetical protein